MEPDRSGNGARLGLETPPSGPEVPVPSWSELVRERARAAIREAFAERPMLTAPQIIEHDDEGLKSGDS